MSAYDEDFYDTINAGSLRSAEVVVPLVLAYTGARRVIDFGCGEGAWLSMFREFGCDIMGVDGPYVDTNRLLIPKVHYIPADLEHLAASDFTDLWDGGADLAVSLEVAEHLRPEAADQFVACLCWHADTVLFSAAVPGQGGTGHVNEQWPAYWVEKFEEQGFQVTGALRWRIWDQAPDPVENWYAQNLLLAVRRETFEARDEELKELFVGPESLPFAIVHPVLYDARRA